ncbi:hypothetical protein [Amycolatopsis australiensis]|uniref:Uncharacterized protein n=1 Tax=Amycolatopsis australiensis TaxID=546364 RepID=A0A1K1SVP7_9PSEU|nr:hypothetical protein [Amycolatopsis australiensis]SFW88374.1 hypothetical protein SAMN04489730_6942 [Amycolatopsis australiensis]
MSGGVFVESAAAHGAWWCTLRLPGEPVEQVRAALDRLARTTGHAWSVLLRGHGAEVAEMTVMRDPSVTDGTPTIDECEAAVEELAGSTGWRRQDRPAPTGIVVPLGLRVSYDQAAHLHQVADVRARLAARVPDATAWPARLVSLHILDDRTPQWHLEPGLVVHALPQSLSALESLAAELGQHRLAVTDWVHHRTYALAQAGWRTA